jgi:CheY-like chemotaxis protein
VRTSRIFARFVNICRSAGLTSINNEREVRTMAQSKPFRPIALLVEDDPIQREMIALLLEETDYDVIRCEDGETAELALKNRHPAVLITDVSLVGAMTGLELAHLAREADPALCIIVMSGKPPAGALPDHVTFFSKPFYPIELIRELDGGRGVGRGN